MPTTSVDITYGVNSDLILSPSEIRDTYLWGVSIKDSNGVELPDSIIEEYIRYAQTELENYLGLKFPLQKVKETIHFNLQNWRKWGYIRCTYPVVCPISVSGLVGTVKQINYPKEWLSARRTSDGVLYHRNIFIVPAGSASPTSYQTIFSGIVPQFGIQYTNFTPNYWEVEYVTGFSKVPGDILNVVGRLASINLFHIAGDLILGAGIASFSIGIDGLSQSISTTSSATNAGYGARIQGYLNDLKRELPRLKDYYRGFSLGSL